MNWQTYTNDGDAFSAWVSKYPPLAEQVDRHLAIIERHREASHLPDLVAGRDAALSLCLLATETGFPAVAAIFYGQYELFCLALTAWV